MNLFTYQLKQAFLSLKKKPGFVFSVISTMGITLGALLCVLTLAYVMLIKPLPYTDQERIYKIEQAPFSTTSNNSFQGLSYPAALEIYKQKQQFERVAISYYGEEVLTSSESKPLLSTSYVTPDWLPLFNGNMLMGRTFEQRESLNDFAPTAILSHQTWQEYFDHDNDIVGKKISVKGATFTVIGVLSADFYQPKLGRITQLYLPWGYNTASESQKGHWGRFSRSLTMIAMININFAKEQVEQSLTLATDELWQEKVSSMAYFADWQSKVAMTSLKEVLINKSRDSIYLLIAAALGVVLIALTNISNLFISHITTQASVISVHIGLGAKKHHIGKLILVEALLMMTLAIGVALAVTQLGFHILQSYLADVFSRSQELSIDGITYLLAFTFLIMLSVFYTKVSLSVFNFSQMPKNSGNKGVAGQVKSRVRYFLIACQVSIALTLIFLMLTIYKAAMTEIKTPLGFTSEKIMQLTLVSATNEAISDDENKSMLAEIKRSLSLHANIIAVSQSSSPLAGFRVFRRGLKYEGSTGEERIVAGIKDADAEYFSMLNLTLKEGEVFSKAMIADDQAVMIVNDVMAKEIDANGSVIGKRLSMRGDDYFTIVGVVEGAVKVPDQQSIVRQAYLPAEQLSKQFIFEYRSAQAPTKEVLLNIINSVTSKFGVFEYESVENSQKSLLFSQYLTAYTTSILTIITVVLASLGLYGVTHLSTQMRRFEIGTRMAIGAKGKDIISMVINDNAGAILLGVGVSVLTLLALYFGLGERITSYFTLALIPLFIVTLALISLISFLACYLPLRQYINKPVIHALKGSE
ncbi:MAG: ABC transporter permease [Colwellia sp.]|nr:ABC transporter permease [Colwellia sp.]